MEEGEEAHEVSRELQGEDHTDPDGGMGWTEEEEPRTCGGDGDAVAAEADGGGGAGGADAAAECLSASLAPCKSLCGRKGLPWRDSLHGLAHLPRRLIGCESSSHLGPVASATASRLPFVPRDLDS